jgi:hypothetical protein
MSAADYLSAAGSMLGTADEVNDRQVKSEEIAMAQVYALLAVATAIEMLASAVNGFTSPAALCATDHG